MRTNDTKTASQNLQRKQDNAPFFKKEGDGAFFAKEQSSAFFSEGSAGGSLNGNGSFFTPTAIQTRLTVGRPNDQYEVEADQMADQVVENTKSTKSFSPNVQAKCAACEAEEKTGATNGNGKLQKKPIFESQGESEQGALRTKPLFGRISRLIQRQPAGEEEGIQAKLLQRQEEEEPMQGKLLQRQEEEEPMQGKLLQRQEEEEPVQGKLLQRQEEEEPVQGKLLQRQEEEEPVQGKLLQRQEEEEPMQGKLLQRQEEEEPMQGKLLQRQEEEEEPIQGKLLQRQEEEEPMQGKLLQRQEEEEPMQGKLLQRQEEEEVQAKMNIQRRDDAPPQPDANFESRLKSTKGQGEPIQEGTRQQMEGNFGVDFSGVRVHTNTSSVQMNQEIGAQAFTHGNDIYFNAGKYQPESNDGQHLLAHELTHTVQQGASVQRLPEIQREEEQVDYAKEIAESQQEAKEAIDPIPAQEAREQAEKEGQEAQEKAEAQKPEAKPEKKEAKKKAEKSRVVKAKKSKPDVVTPAEPAKDQGEVGKSLAEQSAEVCPQAAEDAQKLADNEQAHDQAGEKLEQTEGAVVPPAEEGQSRSNAGQVDGLDGAPEPQPDPEAARQEMDSAIEESVPSSVDQMNKFKSEGKAEVIGSKVLAKSTEDVGEIQGTYNEIENAPPAQETEAPDLLPETEQAPPTAALNLGKDAVPEVSEEQTDLSEFEQESDKKLEEEGITEEQLEMVDSGDLAEAKEGRKDLKQKVVEQPAKMQTFAQEKKKEVETDLQEEEEQGKAQMKAKRKAGLENTQKKQQKAKSEMELKREKVTQHINSIYEKAKASVTKKLNNLEKAGLARFDRGQKQYSKQFEREVNRDVDAWKRDRYSGFWAGVKWLRDKLLGIDDFPEVKNAFTRARARYVERIDGLIVSINEENQRTIEECKQELANAKLDIKKYVDGLGPDLRKTGQAAQKDMKKKLAEMDGFIEKKKKELQEKLCNKKDEAIKAIDKKIEQMKSEMGGLVGKLGALLLQAMIKFFKWALEKVGGGDKVMGVVNKGQDVLKKIVGDPIQFFKNIGSAVGGGIKRFVDNIKKHLLNGLVNWLTGAMGDTGLQMPEKWDLKGIMSLILQVFGLTWTAIRTKLVKRVGEKVVSMAEGAMDIFQRIKADGPIAIWHIIKEKAAEIKQGVMEGIRSWVIAQIVKKATIKLVSMLNPVGAIVQAIIALYDVVMFFMNNWERIVDFVKSIFDSITEIAFGRIGQAAAFIEKSMAMLIPIILNFLSRFIGLSGIGKAVKNIIKRLRQPIDKIVNKIIKFLADKVKGLFKKKTGKQPKGGEDGKKEAGKITAADKKKHKTYVSEIKQKLEKPLKKMPPSFKDFYTLKKKEARELEKNYNKKLKKGIKTKISLVSIEKDKKDNDVDFKISIAPNTVNGSGNSAYSGGEVEVALSGGWENVKNLEGAKVTDKDGDTIHLLKHFPEATKELTEAKLKARLQGTKDRFLVEQPKALSHHQAVVQKMTGDITDIEGNIATLTTEIATLKSSISPRELNILDTGEQSQLRDLFQNASESEKVKFRKYTKAKKTNSPLEDDKQKKIKLRQEALDQITKINGIDPNNKQEVMKFLTSRNIPLTEIPPQTSAFNDEQAMKVIITTALKNSATEIENTFKDGHEKGRKTLKINDNLPAKYKNENYVLAFELDADMNIEPKNPKDFQFVHITLISWKKGEPPKTPHEYAIKTAFPSETQI